MAALQLYSRELGHISLESHLFAGSRTLTDMLLGDEQGAIGAGFGWDVEQYSGLASAHAGEGASTYALISRDEPQLVVAARFGLLEVVELQLNLLVARGLRPDFGHTPVPIEPCGLLGSRYQLDGRYWGFFSQKAEENAQGYHGNQGRCRHAREDDAELLEAVEAIGSVRPSVLFQRR